jgi:hypothetical protein
MFETIEPLSAQQHKSLRFQPARDYGFARGLQVAPLAIREVFDAARCFPVVFPPGDDPNPHALLGLDRDSNAFVDADGRWLADYVPAHVRRYPFILQRTQTDGTYNLALDPRAPQFQGADGEALFEADGSLGPPAERARDFLQTFQQEIEQTRQLFQPVVQAGVLADRQLKARGADGQERRVQGFRTVDETALRELDDKTFLAWRDNGVLGALYACLLSLRNVHRLTPAS